MRLAPVMRTVLPARSMVERCGYSHVAHHWATDAAWPPGKVPDWLPGDPSGANWTPLPWWRARDRLPAGSQQRRPDGAPARRPPGDAGQERPARGRLQAAGIG